jgi:hypothetical protein
MPSILNATTSSGLVTSADNSGSLQLATNNGTTAVTIDTSQNVGIGTASPAKKLDINGDLQVGNATASTNRELIINGVANKASRILFNESGSNKWIIGQGGASETSAFEIFNATTGEIAQSITRSNNQRNSQVIGVTGLYPAYDCRAWVNFNGTGTVAIRASGNVSSLTDNGQGDYTVNFTNAMPDANYLVSGVTSKNANTNTGVFISSQATGNVRVLASVTDGLFDQPTVCVEVVR